MTCFIITNIFSFIYLSLIFQNTIINYLNSKIRMSNPSLLNNTTVMPLIPPIPSVPQVPPPIPSIPSIPGGAPRVPGIPMFPIANNSLVDPTKDLPLPPKNKNIKKYQWSPIKAIPYKGSFWKEMQEKQDKEKVKNIVDYELLEQMFCEAKQDTNKNKDNNSNQVKTGVVKLLDDKKLMNIQISLSKVKFTQEKMKEILTTYDKDNIFDIDTIETIISLYPTDEETNLLKNYTGDVSALSPPEQFCHMLISIENCIKILNFLKFKKNLANDVRVILINIRILSETIKSINNSMKFKQVLFTIRQIGNYLNHGTANGKALGFSITSLDKLDNIKSYNKDKSSLFDFVVMNIKKKEPELIAFYNEFNRLDEGCQIDKAELDKQIKTIESGINLIHNEINKTKNEGYLVFLNNLDKYSSVKLECVKISNKMLNDEIEKIIVTYGINKAKFNLSTFLKTINDFVEKFKSIYIKLLRKEAKVLKKGKGKSTFDQSKSVFEEKIAANNLSGGTAKANQPYVPQQFKSKGEYQKIRESVRKTVARRTAFMKDLKDIKEFIKNEKMNANNNPTSNADNTNTISSNKEQNDNNNKIRITNFKPSKIIVEEDENEKILDEDFFMIKQPIKISSNTELKKSNTITQSPQPQNQQTQQVNPPPVNKNFARGRTSKILTRDEQKNFLKNLI